MSIVTIPVWLLLTAAGIPTLCGLFLAWGLVRLKRSRRSMQVPQPAELNRGHQEMFGEKIHYHILSQQIDAVFNALTAVIEAERTKLKALAFHSLPAAPAPPTPLAPEEGNRPKTISEVGQGDIKQEIAACAADGLNADEIAHRLGISQAEVSLAHEAGGRGLNRR